MKSGIIEVDMFSHEVDTEDHSEVMAFKEVLLKVAEEYGCDLEYFEIRQGTVSFSFNSDELTAEILRVLQNKLPDKNNCLY